MIRAKNTSMGENLAKPSGICKVFHVERPTFLLVPSPTVEHRVFHVERAGPICVPIRYDTRRSPIVPRETSVELPTSHRTPPPTIFRNPLHAPPSYVGAGLQPGEPPQRGSYDAHGQADSNGARISSRQARILKFVKKSREPRLETQIHSVGTAHPFHVEQVFSFEPGVFHMDP